MTAKVTSLPTAVKRRVVQPRGRLPATVARLDERRALTPVLTPQEELIDEIKMLLASAEQGRVIGIMYVAEVNDTCFAMAQSRRFATDANLMVDAALFMAAKAREYRDARLVEIGLSRSLPMRNPGMERYFAAQQGRCQPESKQPPPNSDA